MRAMILAAGRGERLRPITDSIPKPLVTINHKPLIIYHIEALKKAGINEVVINVAYMANKIMKYLGNGDQFDVTIRYSIEQEGALDTGGGIVKALPLLGNKPFITINADILTRFDFSNLLMHSPQLAHLVLVKNPSHHLAGDYALMPNHIITTPINQPTYTFSGIAIYHPALFISPPSKKFSITQLVKNNLNKSIITGELYDGTWFDVGTIKRLQTAENYYQQLK